MEPNFPSKFKLSDQVAVGSLLGEGNTIDLEMIFKNRNEPDFHNQYTTYREALEEVKVD